MIFSLILILKLSELRLNLLYFFGLSFQFRIEIVYDLHLLFNYARRFHIISIHNFLISEKFKILFIIFYKYIMIEINREIE